MELYTLIPTAICPLGAFVNDSEGKPLLDASGKPTRVEVPLIVSGPNANYTRKSVAYQTQNRKVVINDGTGAPVQWAVSGSQSSVGYVEEKINVGRKNKANPNGKYALASGWLVGDDGLLPEGAIKALNQQLSRPSFDKDGVLLHGFRLLTQEELATLPATGAGGTVEDDEEQVIQRRLEARPNSTVNINIRQAQQRPAATEPVKVVDTALQDELAALRKEISDLKEAKRLEAEAAAKKALEDELAELRRFKAENLARIEAEEAKRKADEAAKLAADMAELAAFRAQSGKPDMVQTSAAAPVKEGKTGTR